MDLLRTNRTAGHEGKVATGRYSLHRQLWLSGFQESVSFKLNSALSLFEKAARLFVLYYFFRAILTDSGEFEKVILYLFVATLVEAIVAMELIDEMALRIATGEASYWLVRPQSPSGHLFSYCLGRSFLSIASSSLLLGAIAVVTGWKSMTAVSLFVALASIGLAYLLSFFLQHLLGLLVFVTLNGWGVKLLYRALFYLFSGVMFPLGLLPEEFEQSVRLLPFHHVIATPARACLGQAAASEFLAQFAWVLVAGVSLGILFRSQRHRFMTVGG